LLAKIREQLGQVIVVAVAVAVAKGHVLAFMK